MKHLSSLNKYFYKYKKLFFWGIIFTLLSNFFRILSPQLSKFIIDKVAKRLESDISNQTIEHYSFPLKYVVYYFNSHSISVAIVFCGVGLLLLAILGGVFMFFMRQTIIVMSRHIEFDQKNEIFNHYQKLDIEFYKTHSTGDLMNRISEDVAKVRMYTGPAIMYIINLLGTIGFSLYFMFKENVVLSFYVIAPLPILVVVIYYVNDIIHKKSDKLQSSLSDLTTLAQESYAGIRVVKSFVQEENTKQYFDKKNTEYKKNAASLAKMEALYFPSIALLIGLSTLIAIAAGCLIHLKNPSVVTVGTIAEFVIYVNMLTFPVSAIGLTASMIQRAATSQKRINEFLKITPTIQNEVKKKSDGINQSLEIQIQDLNFTYPHSGINALQNFSLTIANNNKILILGKTGSGKSTLALLLMKLYNADSGRILANGDDIRNIDTKDWRNKIGYVPQDVFLFSESIKNNIEFGSKSKLAAADIENIADIAAVSGEINSFENKYDTVIGERGVTLSGGQKQRIAISRALMKESKLYLFDDCFSAIDNITEKKIGESLRVFLENKSAIFISHRIFMELKFDKIVVLENGNIIEQGNHQDLMRLKGAYYNTYITQVSDN